MRISDWSSDVCSSDLLARRGAKHGERRRGDLGTDAVTGKNQNIDHVSGHLFRPFLILLRAIPFAAPVCRRCIIIRRNSFTTACRAPALTLRAMVSAANAANTRAMGRSAPARSEEHTSELQSLMRISYAVFCLKKK